MPRPPPALKHAGLISSANRFWLQFRQSRIHCCEFKAKPGIITLTVEAACTSLAPAMRARFVCILLTLRLPNGSPRKIE